MNNHFFKQTFFLALFFFAAAVAVKAQTEVKSRLLPDTEYKLTIKKSMGGSNSMKELIPSTSSQMMKIETGAETDAGIPATLTVGHPERSGPQPTNIPTRDWKFSFVATKDGQLTDIKVLAFESDIPPETGVRVFLRYVSDLLFLSVYKTDPKTRVIVTSLTINDKAQSEIAYSIEDEQTNPSVRSEESEPIVTTKRGAAVFDLSKKFFVSRELHEINKIFVPNDPTEKAKDIIMKIDQEFSIEIKSK